MNYYPGSGLAHSTGVLGSGLGLPYPVWVGFPKCKLFGVLLTMLGEPAGKASTTLINNGDGTTALADTWIGVNVTLATATAKAMSSKILGVDKVAVTTNESGYFEKSVVKGETVTITCPSFGKSVTVDTTGLDEIDLSSYF